MSEKYEKPVIIASDDIAEPIYAASGGGGCYTTNAYIHQVPEVGRRDYRIQVNGQHHADHTRDAQVLIISFNQPVTYVSSNGICTDGTSSTLRIKYAYHQNPTDNIGLGDIVVESDPGLAIISAEIYD